MDWAIVDEDNGNIDTALPHTHIVSLSLLYCRIASKMLHLLSHDIPYSVREQTSFLLVHDTTPTASAGPALAAPNLRELVAPAG